MKVIIITTNVIVIIIGRAGSTWEHSHLLVELGCEPAAAC
jgi:hypothetical protein